MTRVVVAALDHRDRRRSLAAGWFGAAAVCLLLSTQAGAGGPAPRACAVTTLEAASRLVDASLACHVRALRQGSPVEGDCLERAQEKFAAAMGKAERKHACDAADEWIRARVETYASSVAGAVASGGTRPGQRCATAKLAATGDGAVARLTCHAKALRSDNPVDPRCLARAHDRFFHAVATAEGHGGCHTLDDAAALEAQTESFLADLVRPGTVQIMRDESRTSSAVIGPEGGTVSTSAADGATYALQIPAGAFASEQTISLTPVTQIVNLPLTEGLVAAVHFAPEGLQFSTPATLTVTVPPGADLTRVLGFVYDGDGDNVRLSLIERLGPVVTLQIAHFSGGGLTLVSLNNFAALLASLPPTLPPGQAAHLTEVAASFEQDAPGLCATTPLCEQVKQHAQQLAESSLASNLGQVCALGQSHVANGEAFLAEQTILPMLNLIAGLQVLGANPTFDCVTAVLAGTITVAGTQAVANPTESLLELLLTLAADAQLVGLPQGFGALFDWQKAALTTVLTQGTQLCQSDPAIGEGILERSCVFTDSQLAGLDLLMPFKDALEQCGLVVEPAVVTTLTAGQQQQFSATLYGQPVTPTAWSVDPPSLGTITADGTFTAGNTGGTGQVRATASIPPPNQKCSSQAISFPGKIATATVTIADVAVSVSPSIVTTAPGTQVQFTATVTGATNTAVSWSATGGSITQTGLFTAGATPGSVTITATSIEDPAESGTATVTVAGAPVVQVSSRSAKVSFSLHLHAGPVRAG
jgi:hypothetical protein